MHEFKGEPTIYLNPTTERFDVTHPAVNDGRTMRVELIQVQYNGFYLFGRDVMSRHYPANIDNTVFTATAEFPDMPPRVVTRVEAILKMRRRAAEVLAQSG